MISARVITAIVSLLVLRWLKFTSWLRLSAGLVFSVSPRFFFVLEVPAITQRYTFVIVQCAVHLQLSLKNLTAWLCFRRLMNVEISRICSIYRKNYEVCLTPALLSPSQHASLFIYFSRFLWLLISELNWNDPFRSVHLAYCSYLALICIIKVMSS